MRQILNDVAAGETTVAEYEDTLASFYRDAHEQNNLIAEERVEFGYTQTERLKVLYRDISAQVGNNEFPEEKMKKISEFHRMTEELLSEIKHLLKPKK